MPWGDRIRPEGWEWCSRNHPGHPHHTMVAKSSRSTASSTVDVPEDPLVAAIASCGSTDHDEGL